MKLFSKHNVRIFFLIFENPHKSCRLLVSTLEKKYLRILSNKQKINSLKKEKDLEIILILLKK